MIQDQPDSSDDLVQSLFDGLARDSIPAGPSHQLLAKTLAAIQRQQREQRSSAQNLKVRSIFASHPARIAAALLLAIGAAALLFTTMRPRAVDWTQIVQKMNQTHLLAVDVDTTRGNKPPIHSRMTISDQGKICTELADEKSILDPQASRFVVLQTSSKTATVMNLANIHLPIGNRPFNLLEAFRQLTQSSPTDLGREEINGQSARKFLVRNADQELTIWADAQIGNPIRVQLVQAPAQSITFGNFALNPTLPTDFFTLAIPSDYSVHQTQFATADFVNQGRKFVDLLRVYSRANSELYAVCINNGLTIFLSKGL